MKKPRLTKQRRVLLEELRNVTCHPTAAELYEMVKQRLPNVSLGTVYRNLEHLSNAGEIISLNVTGTIRRFDGRTDSHYHVRCEKCGAVEDINNVHLENINEKVDQLTDYNITGHRLEFVGLCPKCSCLVNRKELHNGRSKRYKNRD